MKPKLRKKIQIFLNRHIKSPIKKKKIITAAYNFLFYKEKLIGRVLKNKPNLFDYSFIFDQKYFKCDEIYRANSLYGISFWLKKFSNWNKKIKGCIEHGVYFGKAIMEEETFNSGLPAIITFSDFRNKYIREVTEKPIIPIGPYIAYVDDYINDYETTKKIVGKTLLIFPTHSGEGINANYNSEDLIEQAKQIAAFKGIKTIIVCMYYNDILLGRHIEYERKGFKIVTAGRRDDPYFLCRLKSFIKLADYTLSNSVGTHVGYCVYFNKPHYLLKSNDLSYSGDLSAQAGIDEEWTKNKNEVSVFFEDFTDFVSKEQYKIVDKYWGFSFVREKHELYSIFQNLETIYKKSKKSESSFVTIAKDVFGGDSDVFK